MAAIEQHSHDCDRGRKVTEDSVTQRNLPAQRQIRLTNSQIRDLIDHYKAGVSVVRLAEKFQIHKSTVSAHLERAGVIPGRRYLFPGFAVAIDEPFVRDFDGDPLV